MAWGIALAHEGVAEFAQGEAAPSSFAKIFAQLHDLQLA